MQATQPKQSFHDLDDVPVGEGPVREGKELSSELPLVADLDGTVLVTDTLFESIAYWLKVRPLWTMLQMLLLPFSIARTKARLQTGAAIDFNSLPINADVLGYCHKAKAAGRTVWLVTAADQSVADKAGERFGLFDRAVGSNGVRNNKGRNKAEFLKSAFPQGFEYIGDSPADMSVWTEATHASHVGGGEARKRAIEATGAEVKQSFERPTNNISAWRKAMRLHQWAKNALIFVAPTLALTIGEPATLLACVLAFPMLGLMASGTYILNDLLDLPADRAHHSKRRRPFASGRLKLWQGFVAAPVMILAGLTGGALISLPFAATMLSYLAITVTYSLILKRLPMLDAVTLGFLFTLRLIMGGVLAGVAVTPWLIALSMFVFVSLSFAKRHVEILRKLEMGEHEVANRGYKSQDIPITLGLGLATATATPIVMILYILEVAAPGGAFSMPGALWVIPPLISLWMMRIWLLANRSELDDDPVVFAVKDPTSLCIGGAIAASFAFAAFGSQALAIFG